MLHIRDNIKADGPLILELDVGTGNSVYLAVEDYDQGYTKAHIRGITSKEKRQAHEVRVEYALDTLNYNSTEACMWSIGEVNLNTLTNGHTYIAPLTLEEETDVLLVLMLYTEDSKLKDGRKNWVNTCALWLEELPFDTYECIVDNGRRSKVVTVRRSLFPTYKNENPYAQMPVLEWGSFATRVKEVKEQFIAERDTSLMFNEDPYMDECIVNLEKRVPKRLMRNTKNGWTVYMKQQEYNRLESGECSVRGFSIFYIDAAHILDLRVLHPLGCILEDIESMYLVLGFSEAWHKELERGLNKATALAHVLRHLCIRGAPYNESPTHGVSSHSIIMKAYDFLDWLNDKACLSVILPLVIVKQQYINMVGPEKSDRPEYYCPRVWMIFDADDFIERADAIIESIANLQLEPGFDTTGLGRKIDRETRTLNISFDLILFEGGDLLDQYLGAFRIIRVRIRVGLSDETIKGVLRKQHIGRTVLKNDIRNEMETYPCLYNYTTNTADNSVLRDRDTSRLLGMRVFEKGEFKRKLQRDYQLLIEKTRSFMG